MEQAAFVIGAPVSCSDGPCGELHKVVLDPVARRLTHLVVGPARDHEGFEARLVPLSLAEVSGDGIRLRCSRGEFDRLEAAVEEQFLPSVPGEDEWGGQGETLNQPYYGLAGEGVGAMPFFGPTGLVTPGMDQPQEEVYDRVPLGEVEVRRGAEVHARDGRIGRVEGLVVDPADGGVTHVLLQEGHLWGKKDVAVPIRAVEEVLDDEVRLRLSKDEVRDLPPVTLHRRR